MAPDRRVASAPTRLQPLPCGRCRHARSTCALLSPQPAPPPPRRGRNSTQSPAPPFSPRIDTVCEGDKLTPVIANLGAEPALPGGTNVTVNWTPDDTYCQWIRWAEDDNAAQPVRFSVRSGDKVSYSFSLFIITFIIIRSHSPAGADARRAVAWRGRGWARSSASRERQSRLCEAA